MDDLVELGRTAGAYGFRGWVRIVPLESGEVLQKAETWYSRTSRVCARRSLRGLPSSRETASSPSGRAVKRRRRPTPPEAACRSPARSFLIKDAVWAVDLVRCRRIAVNKEGTALGTVESIGSNGAQDLLVIAYDNADGKKAVFMLPLVKDVYLIAIDVRTITVDWQPDWR